MISRRKIGIIFDTSKNSKGHHGTHLAFTGLPGVEQILADPNENELEARMRMIGASKHYRNFRQMIEVEHPDIVVVCSRLPRDHFEAIQFALDHNCHVLCEKPLTDSLEEADRICVVAKERGLKVAVAHLARYALVFRTMKKMIARGDIGRPLTVYGRGKEDERGGGEDMMVLGTHILDLFAFLCGAPEYVFANVLTENRPITCADRSQTSEPVGICAGDSIFAYFRFADGINGIFESRKGLCTGPVRMGITVAGTAGSLSVRYDQERSLRICHSSLPPEDESHFVQVDLLEDRLLPAGAASLDHEHFGSTSPKYFADNNRYMALDLMQAITEDRRPVSDVQDAVKVLEMMYGIYTSAVNWHTVMLPLATRRHPLGD